MELRGWEGSRGDEWCQWGDNLQCRDQKPKYIKHVAQTAK